ncbi:hypothetical protein NECID01_0329 [Nematocida sp. AWRm77]|nr:hypothetical protein NECID01_0329 [Nematocida sp. AWRm77]
MTSVQEREVTSTEHIQERQRPQRGPRFFGMKKHLDVLKGYNNRLREIDEQVGRTKERIEARIEEFRKQTGQKELYDTKKEVQEKIDVLQKEKAEMLKDLKETNQALRTLSQSVGEEKKRLNMKSTVELRNKLASIESRIIEKPLSSKEEKEISNEKNRLIKLLSMQDIFREKDEKIKIMEDQKKSKETLVSVKKQEVEKQYKKLTDVINKINMSKKEPYPEDVKSMKELLTTLNEEKKELYEKKKEEQVVIDKKAKEYEAKSAEMEKAKEKKKALVEQEKVISDLSEQKEELEKSLQKDPCEQLTSLKKTLGVQKSVQSSSKSALSLPFHLVSQLINFKIAIPKVVGDIDSAIAKIDTIYDAEEASFQDKKKEISEGIEKLAAQIKKEQKTLEKLPRPVFPKMAE